ncbi:hypothetical protein MKEN_00516700 [Mycena kentingensis (nom. inval.)]|nr:hypothetical protein MKEN_00516700 [Mycena kentingensis (nom. inval.)]
MSLRAPPSDDALSAFAPPSLLPSSYTVTLLGDATSPAVLKPKHTLDGPTFAALQGQELVGALSVQTAVELKEVASSLPPLPDSSPSDAAPRRSAFNALSTVPVPPEPVLSATPNVYINGLPPDYPEDELYALAAPYGRVKSVRTFTRHFGDSETGYGFVLFDSIAAAERCINSLRRYKNLHPSFSKQVHKIPGTAYAHARPAPPSPPSCSGTRSSSGWDREASTSGDSTFKARMERLADKTSSNLYMEGLPLTIDEPTLAALVSPYAIRSSRFFQTRLSSPPRIIAFVRLESRSAAEEIIERLHGRLVRGLNEAGGRLSVRFADTSEQKELRRQERFAREGEAGSGPGQLSIAQATLLNLRGKEFSRGAANEVHDYANTVREHRQDIDYPRAPLRSNSDVDACPRYPDASARQLPVPPRMNPGMASLLETLQAQADRTHRVPMVADVRPFVPQSQLGMDGSDVYPAFSGYSSRKAHTLHARGMGAQAKRRPLAVDVDAANFGMHVRGLGEPPALSLRRPSYEALDEELFHSQTQTHTNTNSTRIYRNDYNYAQSFSNQHQHQRQYQAGANSIYTTAGGFPTNCKTRTSIYHENLKAPRASQSQHIMYSNTSPPPVDGPGAAGHSPPLVSPALTYSSRSSASGYSPTTPYFASGTFAIGGQPEQMQESVEFLGVSHGDFKANLKTTLTAAHEQVRM